MAFQISVPAVGYVRWTESIRVPMMKSMSEQNLIVPVDVERAGVEMFNGRQPRAQGGVLTGGTATSFVHDS